MNREIRFRGVSSFSKKWVYGNYAIIDGLPSIIEDSVEFIDGSELRSYSWDYVIHETIGQFTGLKDKNGKEIYEGDIVQWEECVADYTFVTQKSEVFYNGNSASFEPLNEFSYCDFEVIGNIYDNENLLNQE